MLRRSRRRHYIWRFCSTPTERRDWRIKTKKQIIVAKKIFDKKNYFIAISSLIRFFNIRVGRKKTKNYYYQHDEALKKRKLYSSENRSVFVLDEIVWAKCFKICPYFWIIKSRKILFWCSYVKNLLFRYIVNFVKHKTLYFWRVAEDDYFLLKNSFWKN